LAAAVGVTDFNITVFVLNAFECGPHVALIELIVVRDGGLGRKDYHIECDFGEILVVYAEVQCRHNCDTS
jgi:hypothetical protein